MNATIVKLPDRYVLIVGKGKAQVVEYARSGYKCAQIAKEYGVTKIIQGSIEECLKFTPMEE